MEIKTVIGWTKSQAEYLAAEWGTAQAGSLLRRVNKLEANPTKKGAEETLHTAALVKKQMIQEWVCTKENDRAVSQPQYLVGVCS